MTTSIATPFAEDKGSDGDGAVRQLARTSAVTISRLRAKHTLMTPLVVEAPQVQRSQGKIAHEGLIAVAAHLKQVQLRRGLFWHGMANDDEASCPRPALRGIPELRGPHTRR